jgi:hypothetical protein
MTRRIGTAQRATQAPISTMDVGRMSRC